MRDMWHDSGMETTLTQNWIPTADPFGARLALIRHRMGWNLKEASTECGFTINQWASWETGRMPRDYQEVCEKISKRTGVDLVWLVLGSQRQPSDYQVEVSRPRRSRPANRSDFSGPRTRA